MDLLCTEQIQLNDYNYDEKNKNVNNTTIATTTTATTTTSNTNDDDDDQDQLKVHGQYINNDNKDNSVISYSNGFNYVNRALVDPTFLTERCLENLLKQEEKYTIQTSYFDTIQRDITPPMRKIVAEWMIEVCEERKCQEEVVLLALNYLDRFLSKTPVRKTHLQILAAACLLLASKLREPMCRCLSADMLVIYTDNSIYKHDLINWELHVLSRLNWDLSSVTALDFLEILLIRLPIDGKELPHILRQKIRQYAQKFVSLAAKELHFTMYTASTIAASSIAVVLTNFRSHILHLKNKIELKHLLNLLTDLIGVEQDYIRDCMMKLECIYEEYNRKLQPYLLTLKAQHLTMNVGKMSVNKYQNENNNLILISSSRSTPSLGSESATTTATLTATATALAVVKSQNNDKKQRQQQKQKIIT